MYRYLLLLSVIPHAAAQLSSCFFPSGQQVPLSRGYQPCISTQNVVSMCCILNITALETLGKSYNDFDSCLTNGLCQTPQSHHSRGFCTDPTWKSPNCLNACTDPSNGGSSETVDMVQCPDGSWCCGSQNTTCCNSKLGIQLANAIPPFIVPTSTGTSPGSSSSGASPGSSPTGSCAPNVNQSSSNNGATIGLGAALGVVIIAVAVVGLFLWRKTRKGATHVSELDHPSQGHYPDPKLGYPAQLQSPGVRHEVSADVSEIRPVEMDGRVEYRK